MRFDEQYMCAELHFNGTFCIYQLESIDEDGCRIMDGMKILQDAIEELIDAGVDEIRQDDFELKVSGKMMTAKEIEDLDEFGGW